MPVDVSRFFDGFFDEVAEHLATLEEILVGFDIGEEPDPDQLDAIFRAAHSIKGGSATFGFTEMAAFTHGIESILDRMRKGTLAPSIEIIDTLLRAVDALRGQLAAYRRRREPDVDVARAVTTEIQTLLASADVTPQPGMPSANVCYSIAFTSCDAPDARIAIYESIHSALASLGTLTVTSNGANGAWEATLETTQSEDELRELFEFVLKPGDALTITRQDADAFGFFEDEPVEQKVDAPKPAVGETTTIRVNLDKIDKLINLVGELVIAQSRLAIASETFQTFEYEPLQGAVEQIARHTRDLRESVMSIRMLPVSTVFNRFPRLVRELAGRLGKDVTLKTSGDDTELDKGLIEQIVDPLTHLIRNALDHGIETPEQRVASCKPATGTIMLRSSHQGGNVLIEIEDDGRGLDRDRIIAKARAHGMAVNEHATDAEVWQLIWAAGFSTAEHVSDLSGRGVGMDVVRRNISSLGGAVELASQPGAGTRITIRLPLTLAIVDGLSVGVAGSTYIVPLNFIVESLQPRRDDVRTIARGGDVIQFRGEPLEVIALHRVLESCDATRAYEDGILIVVEADSKRAAFFVDSLEGQHQVVVKSLETNFRAVHGIAGATVLGNGRVAFIVDVASLVRSTQAQKLSA